MVWRSLQGTGKYGMEMTSRKSSSLFSFLALPLFSPIPSGNFRCQISDITYISMATDHNSAYTWLEFTAGEAGL